MKIFWILSHSSISFALLAHFCIFIKNPTNVLHKYLGTDYTWTIMCFMCHVPTCVFLAQPYCLMLYVCNVYIILVTQHKFIYVTETNMLPLLGFKSGFSDMQIQKYICVLYIIILSSCLVQSD